MSHCPPAVMYVTWYKKENRLPLKLHALLLRDHAPIQREATRWTDQKESDTVVEESHTLLCVWNGNVTTSTLILSLY